MKIGFLRRGPSFVGMTRFGWLLWIEVVGTYAEVPPLSGLQLWVIALEWVICFLRRGPSFVGMTILGGWRAY